MKAVFFDFGDTLATLSPPKEELFRRAARSVGLELGVEAVKRAYQIVDFHNKFSSVRITDEGREDFYRGYNEQLCEALGVSGRFAELAPELTTQFKSAKGWELFEEVPGVLRRLRQRGLPLALVANWDRNLEPLTERLGIRRVFDLILPSQLAGSEKPDPAIFRRAAEELALSANNERILYLGNEYRADVLGARAAGLTPVLIDRGRLYEHADCLRFVSLLEWLESAE